LACFTFNKRGRRGMACGAVGQAWQARHGVFRRGEAGHGKAWQARLGQARRGMARRGVVGTAWRGKAGKARSGRAWFGPARQGLAGRDSANSNHPHACAGG
jgi:hypothetical protein